MSFGHAVILAISLAVYISGMAVVVPYFNLYSIEEYEDAELLVIAIFWPIVIVAVFFIGLSKIIRRIK
jgi:hypothetical protein